MKNSDLYAWPLYLFGAIATFFAITTSLNYQFIPDIVTNNEALFSLIGFYWFTGLLAYSLAITEGKKIKYGISINHTKAFLLRFLYIASAAYIMQVNSLYVLSAAFFFSIIFNLNLNSERKKSWYYLSDSNLYDRSYLRLYDQEIVVAGKMKLLTEVISTILIFLITYF